MQCVGYVFHDAAIGDMVFTKRLETFLKVKVGS